jgi:hypothetical protein
MPQHPTELSEMLTRIAGQVPVISTHRGFRGWSIDGRSWEPFAIMGGDGEEEGETPPPPPPPNDPPKEEQKPENFSREYVEGLRKEAADNRRKAVAAEAKLKEQDDAKLSETERLQKERDEATARAEQTEARARQRVIRSEVRVVASELGFADPSDAHRFLDDDAIELDDDGEPKNVKALLEKLAKDKPYLLKAEDKRNGPPDTPRSNGGPKSSADAVRQEIESMRATGRYTV